MIGVLRRLQLINLILNFSFLILNFYKGGLLSKIKLNIILIIGKYGFLKG